MRLNEGGNTSKTPSSYVMNQFNNASKPKPPAPKGAGLAGFKSINNALNKANNAQILMKAINKPTTASKTTPKSIVKTTGALATLAKYSTPTPKPATAYAKMNAITQAAAKQVHTPIIGTPKSVIAARAMAAHPAILPHPSVAKHQLTSTQAHQVSVAALSGNPHAQSYLNAVHVAGSTPAHKVTPTKPITSPVSPVSHSNGGVHPVTPTHPVTPVTPVTPTTPTTPAHPATDWSKYAPAQLDADYKLRQQYLAANPLSDYAKSYDMQNYNTYTNRLKNGEAIDQNQLKWYQNATNKWNLTDYSDPLAQQQDQYKKDNEDYLAQLDAGNHSQMAQFQSAMKSGLDGQDISLNNGLASIDANSFQQQQQLQQQMEDRGMGASGIAADTYMRALMGNNQSYQQAYADASNNKASIQQQYAQAMAQSQNDYIGNKNQAKLNLDNTVSGIQNQMTANKQAKIDAATRAQADAQTAKAAAQTAQEKQDEFRTTQTGVVWKDGKPLTDSKGKPITTIDYAKMSETQRHNLANETITSNKNAADYSLGSDKNAISRQKNAADYALGADKNAIASQKNAQDYALGSDKNAIARQKIAADVTTKMAQMKLDYSKLDFNYAKLDANNKVAQSKLDIMKANAQTSADKAKIDSLGKQLSSLTSRITATQKAGKPVNKTDVTNYNKVLGQLQGVAGNFKTSSGGGGTTSAGQSSFSKNFASSGVDKSWYPLMAEIVRKESSYNPKAKNPTSTAYGYGQFLASTRRNYEKKLGLNYDNPVDQITMMAEYIKDRYGTPAKANAFWNANHWY